MVFSSLTFSAPMMDMVVKRLSSPWENFRSRPSSPPARRTVIAAAVGRYGTLHQRFNLIKNIFHLNNGYARIADCPIGVIRQVFAMFGAKASFLQEE